MTEKQTEQTKGEKLNQAATPSGIPILEVYGPKNIKDLNYEKDLGQPGEFPFTRGVYSNMYRRRFATRRF